MQRSALCRSRRELSKEYLLAKIGFDTAENELLQVLFNIIQYYSILFIRVLRYDWQDHKDIVDLKSYWLQMDAEARGQMSRADRVQVREYLAELAEMEHHKLSCQRQTLLFKNDLSRSRDIDSGLAVIVGDYKQNMEIGHGPVEQDDQFYNYVPCTVIPFCVHLPGAMTVHCVFLSKVLSHDSEISCFVTSGLVDKLARDKATAELWKGIKEISIWTDCGPHFRSEEFSSFCMYDLPLQERKTVRKNHFGEKHGKGPSDTVSQKLECYHNAYTETERVANITDMKTCFDKTNEKVNKVRADHGLPEHNMWVEIYTEGDVLLKRQTTPPRRLPMEGIISSTYCIVRKFKRNRLEGFVRDYTFSDLQDTDTFCKITSKPEAAPNGPLKVAPEAPEPTLANAAFLRRKRCRQATRLEEAGTAPQYSQSLQSLFAGEDHLDMMYPELGQLIGQYGLKIAKVEQAREFARGENQLLVFYHDTVASWVFGRVLGQILPDDVRNVHKRLCCLRETYYSSATVLEVVTIEELVDGAMGIRKAGQKGRNSPHVWFLQAAAGSPVDLGIGPQFDRISERLAEPSDDLRHTHSNRYKDYWSKCYLCSKWRIVAYDMYLSMRKSTAIFQCSPSCETPHTDEEMAGLEENPDMQQM